jgi:glucose/arabinose dehydrogenase
MRRIRNLVLFGVAALVVTGGLVFVFRGAILGRLLGVSFDVGPGGEATLVVPDGYVAMTFASGLSGPRFMAVAPDGTLVVAERGADRVVALPDTDGDGHADDVVVIGTGYGRAHAIAFDDDGSLLVAGEEALYRVLLARGVERSREAIVDGLPTGGHSTKTLAVLDDGSLLLSIGSSCNVCEETDARRASVQAVTDAGGLRPYMVGLRNAVGLWVDPGTGRAWATNMGRDRIGDDRPPETLYELVHGADAGWPRCHAGTIRDPEFGTDPASCSGVAVPAATFPAHTAPLALVGWDDHLIVALHGSWNSSVKVGYAVWRIAWDGAPAGEPEPFVTGFLPDGAESALGRPAGPAVGADGALYVSDDKSGFIYRIARSDE